MIRWPPGSPGSRRVRASCSTTGSACPLTGRPRTSATTTPLRYVHALPSPTPPPEPSPSAPFHLPPPFTSPLGRPTLQVPPYIKAPPSVIRIDTGRQLFVDSFLIDTMTGATRDFHSLEYSDRKPCPLARCAVGKVLPLLHLLRRQERAARGRDRRLGRTLQRHVQPPTRPLNPQPPKSSL